MLCVGTGIVACVLLVAVYFCKVIPNSSPVSCASTHEEITGGGPGVLRDFSVTALRLS